MPLEPTINKLTRSDFCDKKGYRGTDAKYAFYDVFWSMVSDHYLIQTECRFRDYTHRGIPKPILGPLALEILEGDLPESSIDARCLEILKSHLLSTGITEKELYVRTENRL